MKMIPVASSNIAEIGYDSATRTMHVRFKNGGLYACHDVLGDEYHRFMAAPSKGAYFHAHHRAFAKKVGA